MIYLCSPNNPTGAVYRREQLAVWVAYALEHHAVILFDAAYEAFVDDPALPHSIYEIEGAKQCAIEFCSFSKTAGFTGTRCGYTVVPHELCADGISLSSFGCGGRRQNLTASLYIVQRGAEAVFTPEGQAQVREAIAYYRENASVISDTMAELGVYFTGGKNSPYIWLKCPGKWILGRTLIICCKKQILSGRLALDSARTGKVFSV